MPITTKVVSSKTSHGYVYSIQHYMKDFVSDLCQVGGFLQELRFPPDHHDMTVILLKVALIIMTLNLIYIGHDVITWNQSRKSVYVNRSVTWWTMEANLLEICYFLCKSSHWQNYCVAFYFVFVCLFRLCLFFFRNFRFDCRFRFILFLFLMLWCHYYWFW